MRRAPDIWNWTPPEPPSAEPWWQGLLGALGLVVIILLLCCVGLVWGPDA